MPILMENGQKKYYTPEEYIQKQNEERTKLGIGADGKLKHYTIANEDLDCFWINGQKFNGLSYGGLLSTNTKTYVEEPKRVNDGSMPNINDHDTFVVPRVKFNLKYFNIQDYQRLCEAISSNEFIVEYYDKQFNDGNGHILKVRHKMYAEPSEMEKLYNVENYVFGVLDYTVSFIGTLNDLEEYTVTFDSGVANVGEKHEPTKYNETTTYKIGDIVYLEDSGTPSRYFQAIWFSNSFKGVELTNTTYWKSMTYSAYSSTATYSKNYVVYEEVTNDEKEVIGRNYYIAKSSFTGKPLIDSYYWQPITVKTYDEKKTYTSNKTSTSQNNYGNFVIKDGAVYQAIYYSDSFSNEYPTNATYWASKPNPTGITVKWGNSIVLPDAETLFTQPNNYVSKNEWNTKIDGTGYNYAEGQSLNIYKNITFYAQWEINNG